MQERLTEYDPMRKIYLMKPDVAQGQHIQRLGYYEDRDDATISRTHYTEGTLRCIKCHSEVNDSYTFCPGCGQRLRM